MEFLIVKLGDVSDRHLYPWKKLLLPCVVEGVRLEYGNIDATQKFKIGEVCQRALADDRHHAAGCPVIDDIREILGDTHRDAGRASRLQLDDPSVDKDRVGGGGCRPCGGSLRRHCSREQWNENRPSENDRTRHDSSYLASRLFSRTSASAAPRSRARRYQERAVAAL